MSNGTGEREKFWKPKNKNFRNLKLFVSSSLRSTHYGFAFLLLIYSFDVWHIHRIHLLVLMVKKRVEERSAFIFFFFLFFLRLQTFC